MNKIERDIQVLRDLSNFDKISYVQGTNAIPIIFHIKDYDIPSGSTARVYVQRPDETIEYDTAEISGNDVTVDVKSTMFSVAGNSILQIKLIKEDRILITFGITVYVKRNYVDDSVRGKNKTDVLEDTFEEIKTYMEDTKKETERFKNVASNKAGDAEKSADTASAKASEASASAEASKTSETNAEKSADTASAKASEASASAEASKTSETNAARSEAEAESHSLMSKSYAEGTGNVVRPNDETDNSKFYSELAQQLVDEAEKLLEQAKRIVESSTSGSLIPAGTVEFKDLPSNPIVGYMYNISDDFTTDGRFAEGAGIFYRAGANVYWSADGKWDVMIGTQVTGVKGNAESGYRFGNVNITPANIGLGNVDNTEDADKSVASAASAAKLDSNAGSETQPIYFKNGKPAACTHSLGKTVPSNASFTDTWEANTASSDGYVASGSGQADKVWKTDANGNPAWRNDENTTYSAATTSADGLMTATMVTKLAGIAEGANKVSIIDSLLATVKGSALDATQGKALNDKVTELSDKFPTEETKYTSFDVSTISSGVKTQLKSWTLAKDQIVNIHGQLVLTNAGATGEMCYQHTYVNGDVVSGFYGYHGKSGVWYFPFSQTFFAKNGDVVKFEIQVYQAITSLSGSAVYANL